MGECSLALVCRGEFSDLVVGSVRSARGGILEPGEGPGVPGEAWRGIQSVLLVEASCGVVGLRHDDGSSQIRIWEVAGLLAWFLLAVGPSRPDSCNQLIDSGRPFVLLVCLLVVRKKNRGDWRGFDRCGETWRGLERERESSSSWMGPLAVLPAFLLMMDPPGFVTGVSFLVQNATLELGS